MEKTEHCNLPSLDSSPIYIFLLCPLLFIFIQSQTIPVLSVSLCCMLIYAVTSSNICDLSTTVLLSFGLNTTQAITSFALYNPLGLIRLILF